MSTKQQVIEKLLQAMNGRQWNMSAAFGGASGAASLIRVLPADMNKAIQAWLEQDDAEGMLAIAGTLHAVGSLTDSDYEQIMKAIDGET